MANLGKLAIAMLGVLAYQNRDKIGDLIRGTGERDPNNPQGGVLDQLSKGVSGTALGDILERFRTAGAGPKVDSWVGTGPNEPIEPRDVEAAIDGETLTALTRQTGLSREELIDRITRDLPEAVNKMTPNGALPATEPGRGSDEPTLLEDVPARPTQSRNPAGEG
ncbi:YidB family protein [Mesorhizobium sp. WSM2561]|uniref:YidB family protein n=1 Tax=Mesorhizobium sp. WSM2561 TaxID=1040985 RepID=UPI000480B579|nr:YidB family protein [Mesorhizobium sp. WSM2561]